MISPQPELVWQGRIHLGDEPGTFTDASYSGLSTEMPLTVRNTNPAATGDTITLFLHAENVQVFSGYPGHLIRVFYYKESNTPFHWTQTLYKEFRLTDVDLQIDIDMTSFKPSDAKRNIYISVSIEIDTDVAPGLYNDFVLISLKAVSDQYKYVANLGFDYY